MAIHIWVLKLSVFVISSFLCWTLIERVEEIEAVGLVKIMIW